MKRISTALAMLLLLFAAGCSDDSSPNKYVIDFRSGIPMFQLPESVDWSLVTSRMMLMRTEYYDVDSGRVLKNDLASAFFYTEQANFTDVGKVSINGYMLSKISANKLIGFEGPLEDIIHIGTAYERKLDMEFGGKPYEFEVEGSQYFNPMQTTVESPQDSIRMVLPSNGKTYNKTNGFSIQWQCEADQTSAIRLLIETSDGYLLRFVDNTGYYNFSAGEMAALPSGEAVVSVLIGNYRIEQLEYGYYAIAAVGAVHSVRCKLTE
jgi:hypothetical protein